MSRRKPSSDFLRVWVSLLVSTAGAAIALAILDRTTGVDLTDRIQLLVTVYVVGWPLYTAVYVGWSVFVYSKLDSASLRRALVNDDRTERKIVPKLLGVTGTTNTTISAAVLAVVVTVAIAQSPLFSSQAIYIGLALLTVASSWVLMVFSFAQSYLRLGAGEANGGHLRFHFSEEPHFSDYITLGVLVSTMAATVPAEISSRRAWRLVRTNVVIAFVFNSVIIAMMVSLLFGGLTG